MSNLNSIADKIRKIITKADGTSHPEEAETFMGMAQKMMMEHGLSLLDIGRLDADDPVGVDKDCASVPSSYTSAKMVASELARFYGCKLVYNEKYNADNKKVYSFSVAGRESARITFQLMFPFVWRQLMSVAREGYNSGGYSSRMQALTFVANALSLRISKLNREQAAERSSAPKTSGRNMLVPVDLIELAFEEAFPHTKKGRAGKMSTNGKSQALAGKVSLHHQTTAAHASRQIA